nr:MAG TPA: hypothetical protein [Caudoviricetes sp.]
MIRIIKNTVISPIKVNTDSFLFSFLMSSSSWIYLCNMYISLFIPLNICSNSHPSSSNLFTSSISVLNFVNILILITSFIRF